MASSVPRYDLLFPQWRAINHRSATVQLLVATLNLLVGSILLLFQLEFLYLCLVFLQQSCVQFLPLFKSPSSPQQCFQHFRSSPLRLLLLNLLLLQSLLCLVMANQSNFFVVRNPNVFAEIFQQYHCGQVENLWQLTQFVLSHLTSFSSVFMLPQTFL